MFCYDSGDPGARIAREARELGGEHKARLSLLSVLQSHISMPRDRATAVPVFYMHAAALACVPVLWYLYFSRGTLATFHILNLQTINVKILD